MTRPISKKSQETIIELHKVGLNGHKISQKLNIGEATVSRYLRKSGISTHILRSQSKIGSRNPAWKGGRREHRGYILIKNASHPRSGRDGYIFEHILIWERIHNRPLPDGWIVHHINGIKSDNRPKNLLGMPKKGHHSYLILQETQRQIRELEAENKLLQQALDQQQMIWWSEN